MADSARGIERGDIVFTEQEVTAAVDRLAVRLSARFDGLQPTLVCMMKGGLMFSAALMQRLHMPMRLEYIHLSRYRDAMRGGEIEWHVRPPASIKGRTVLLVDDICDEGFSLDEAVRALGAAGAREVVTAVLVQRRGAAAHFSPDFAALESGPGFLVGWGMDTQDMGRNLTAIHKITNDEESA